MWKFQGKVHIQQDLDASSKQRLKTHCLYPNVEVPLQANGSVNILEVIKSTVCVFDNKIISFGSSRSYKNSKHLLINFKRNVEVPRESTYTTGSRCFFKTAVKDTLPLP